MAAKTLNEWKRRPQQRGSEANQLLSIWNSTKYESAPTGEIHEIDAHLRATLNVRRRTNKCFNRTILTHNLFDYKGFCDTLAFLDKNMILFVTKYHHKNSSLANRTEQRGSFYMKKSRQNASDRHTRLIGLLKRRGYCSVVEMSQLLNVSPMTIRRDLHTLHEKQIAEITHGGA